jgi:hypothetical protein
MSLTMGEAQAVTELSELLYSFLPGKPYPYADQSISFPGVASRLGLAKYWRPGSKRPAIAQLLRLTLEGERGKFCNLILECVQTGMLYRANKGTPISVEEIETLNAIVARMGFKIPDLWDKSFLSSLPRAGPAKTQEPEKPAAQAPNLGTLRTQLLELADLEPQPRGYAFEKFLNGLFLTFSLEPRGPFRLVGEQIDGSFELNGRTYLLEAKWQDPLVGLAELLEFQGKVEGKAKWSRGLFISHSGFSPDGLVAFGRGRPTSILGVSGQDLYFIVEGEAALQQGIEAKARRAAESGDFFVPLFELLHGG